jgi:hypothetical protein
VKIAAAAHSEVNLKLEKVCIGRFHARNRAELPGFVAMPARISEFERQPFLPETRPCGGIFLLPISGRQRLTHILCTFMLAKPETSRHLALQQKTGSRHTMRTASIPSPMISVAALEGVRGIFGALLLVLVLILTSITGAVSAPAS